MKYRLILIILFMSFQWADAQESVWKTSDSASQTPFRIVHLTPVQKQLIDRRYGMFIHFGLNTYLNIEWGDGQAPVSVYKPTKLDCEQWVRTARDAGFRYVLLVTKHHDGFCLWDSKATDYDVASTDYPTDVVKAVSDACRKYGIQFAIYYSLWDRHEPSYASPDFSQYIRFMETQLTELMTQYGEVCELWLDGAWDKGVSEWQLPRICALVKKYQPMCAVGVNHGVSGRLEEEHWGWDDCILPDSCRVDNRYYLRFSPVDFRLWDPKIAPHDEAKYYMRDGVSYYTPFEHTICLSKVWCWFSKDKPLPVRNADELEELFYWTTMNDNTLVIDVAPAPDGRLWQHEADAIVDFARRMGFAQGKPLPHRDLSQVVSFHSHAEATSVYLSDKGEYGADKAVDGGMQTRWAAADDVLTPSFTLRFDNPRTFNRIAVFEYQETHYAEDNFTNYRKNRIQKYFIEVKTERGWEIIYVGDEPMGDCKVIRFAYPYTTDAVRLRVTESTAPPSIYEFECIAE